MSEESDKKDVSPLTSFERCLEAINDLVEQKSAEEMKQLMKGLLNEAGIAAKQLAGLAREDPLTGALNREGFFEKFRSNGHVPIDETPSVLPHPCRRRGDIERRTMQHPFCVAFLDLDWFKGINDELGHMAGDTVLKVLVQYLFADFRKSDVICRWGGDEFVIVLRGGSEEVSERRLANVQMKLRDHLWEFTDSEGNPRSLSRPVTFTVKTEMANGEADLEKVLQVIQKADEGMCAKKRKR